MQRLRPILFAIFASILSVSAFAQQSTYVKPRLKHAQMVLTPYLDEKECTTPIRSGPYVIIGGNGGGDMNLRCPPNKPIMYGWRQQMGYAGSLAISFGGGRAWITCCPVSQAWKVRIEPKVPPRHV